MDNVDEHAALVEAVREKMAGPRKVWVLSYDTDNGGSGVDGVYATMEKAKDALWDCASNYSDRDDYQTIVDALANGDASFTARGGDDWFGISEHDVVS